MRLLLVALFFLFCSTVYTGEPKTLLFSPITPEHLADRATDWKQKGFDGFILSNIMVNWDSDVWATDGDPDSRGENDGTLLKCLRANRACADAGIFDNYLKTAFFKPLPDYDDDDGWNALCRTMSEGVRFARMAEFKGMAIDTEYIYETYNDNSKPLDADVYRKIRNRGGQLANALLDAYPEMPILSLPETPLVYGPKGQTLLMGVIEAMAQRNSPGGFHIMTEWTYKTTDHNQLLSHVAMVARSFQTNLSEDAWNYWKTHCSIAVGTWPLGYYRPIYDERGEHLGYSGRRKTFGNELAGSYADKSSNYSPEEFESQFAFARSFSKHYAWVYAHGTTFWQLSDDEIGRLNERDGARLPTDSRLEEYIEVIRNKKPLRDQRLLAFADELKQTGCIDIQSAFSFIDRWMLTGPFENLIYPARRHTALERSFPPEQEIDFSKSYVGKKQPAEWREAVADSLTGYVDGRDLFEGNDELAYYAHVYIESDNTYAAELRVGSNDGVVAWLNGERVLYHNDLRYARMDQNIVPIVLPKGRNRLLLKIAQKSDDTGFWARITDREGYPIESLQYSYR